MLSAASGSEPNASDTMELFSASTALFVENQGQWRDESVRYAFDGPGANIAFTDQGLSFLLTKREKVHRVASRDLENPLAGGRFDDLEDYVTGAARFSISFDGANTVAPIGLDAGETRFNYYVDDRANWRSDVRGYEVVAYENLYAGIDLHTFGRRDSLKYEFHVAPGADYRQIAASYDGIEGLSIDENGALHVETELGQLVDDTPYIYQLIDGRETEVAGRFSLVDADTYAFEITGAYDPNVELVIDPDLAWSTYLGGSGSDSGLTIAVDASGSVFVAGTTTSSDFPVTPGAHDTSLGGDRDGFVAKFSGDGTLQWTTYLGGSESDWGKTIAVDASGSAFVMGVTRSSDFPTTAGAYDTSFGGENDGFVAKLSSDGALQWATYLGGSGREGGEGIVVDASGSALVTSYTTSSDFPTTPGAHDTSFNGDMDAVVAKFSGGGTLQWATYLGGSGPEIGGGIAVDASGSAFVTGWTESIDFPVTAGAHDTSLGGGEDAFVAKFSSDGTLQLATYLGGSEQENAHGIAVDASGSAFVTGWTVSTDFPTTPGAYDTSLSDGGFTDAFVAKFSGGGALQWATYLGGSESETPPPKIAVDASGSAFVAGRTRSSDFPTTPGAYDTSLGGTDDAFVAKFSGGGALQWATYLGGSGSEIRGGIAVDASGSAFVTGRTTSSDFPTTPGAYDTSLDGVQDVFVTKFTGAGSLPGDFDSDGYVDGDDFLAWQIGFGTPSGATLSDGDAEGDGDVDGDDFLIWQQNFGAGEGAAVSMAPPSAALAADSAQTTDGLTGSRLAPDPIRPFAFFLVDLSIRDMADQKSQPATRVAVLDQVWENFNNRRARIHAREHTMRSHIRNLGTDRSEARSLRKAISHRSRLPFGTIARERARLQATRRTPDAAERAKAFEELFSERDEAITASL